MANEKVGTLRTSKRRKTSQRKCRMLRKQGRVEEVDMVDNDMR